MFTVYQSSELDTLLSILHKIIKKKPLSSIFEKEIIINDNEILFQYLNIFIAKKTGISSHFKLYRPDHFIWKLFNKFLSKKELNNEFTQSILTWKMMEILEYKKYSEHISMLSNKMKKFKFSFLIANIFEKYLLYRPNWINAWEKEKNTFKLDVNDEWQRQLWKEIIHNHQKNYASKNHFSNLFKKFQSLTNKETIKKYFPNRCFIISSFSLNPSYIKILKKISIYTDIYFLYVTPSPKNIPKNTLMKLWGQQELFHKTFISNSKKIKTINIFKNKKNNNLLNNIKNDLLKNDILKKKDFYN